MLPTNLLHIQQMQQQQQSTQQPPQTQTQQPPQGQQPSQTQQQQNQQQLLSAHSQVDQNQRNGMHIKREQRLLNAYVYDFLKRSGATETAKAYLREGDFQNCVKNDGTVNSINGSSSSDNDNTPLPDVDVPVQAPEGFLYEWWTVFWDIYSAKLNRPGTADAHRYVVDQQMRNSRNRMRLMHDSLNQIPVGTFPQLSGGMMNQMQAIPGGNRVGIPLQMQQSMLAQNAMVQAQNAQLPSQSQQPSTPTSQVVVSGSAQVHMAQPGPTQANPSLKRNNEGVNQPLSSPTKRARMANDSYLQSVAAQRSGSVSQQAQLPIGQQNNM
ncbi:35287_t:CDS:2, partial [Racocetra persica]